MANVETSLRSAGWVGLGSLGQLVLQFVFQLLLAKYFGASEEMDAYVAALALPTVVGSILFGSLSYAFVPVFSGQLDRGEREQAWATAGTMGLLLVILSGGLALAMVLLAAPLTALLYPGFSGERAAQTAELLHVLAWLVLTNGLITYLQAIYHSHRRFIAPALGALVGVGVTVAVAVVWHQRGIASVGWAVLVGSLVAIVFQLPLPLAHLRYRGFDPATARCLRLLAPLVLGAMYFRLDPLVDRYLASSLPVGSVSHLGYAWRLASGLLMVGTGSLSVVAFPSFARHSAAGRWEAFHAEVAYAMRCLAVVLAPMAAAILCYALPLVRDLLQRGKFTSADSVAVAWLLVLYVGAIVGAGASEIVSKAFYALGSTRLPVAVGCAAFTVALALKVALAGWIGAAGIALATSAYFVLNAAVLTWWLVRRVGGGVLAGLPGAVLRATLASGAAAAAAWPIVEAGFPWASLVAAACGGIVYLAVLLLERDEFALKGWQYVGCVKRTGPRDTP